MKKITKVTKVVEREDYYCDVCGNKVDSLDMKFCDVCRKMMCIHCTVRSENEFDGESPSYYCRGCWNIGEVYRADIERERDKRDANIAMIEDMWKRALHER